jgi:hypothetical protein
MNGIGRRLPVLMSVVLLASLVAAAAAPAEATRTLAVALHRTGRAEVTLAWQLQGAPGSSASTQRGSLALELPELARLDVAGSGERITLRADGGEWLQPALHQMMLLTARHSVAAMRWWRVLAGAGDVRERRLAAGHFRLRTPATPAAAADSADVWLDARGLPARLELDDGAGGRQVYRLSGWRFTRARGAAAFRLSAPAGVETVELP